MNKIGFIAGLLLLHLVAAAQVKEITVPLGGNAYANGVSERLVTRNGIENWNDGNTSFKVYVRFSKTGNLAISLNNVTKINGENQLSLGINNQNKTVAVAEGKTLVPVGEWQNQRHRLCSHRDQRIKKDWNTVPKYWKFDFIGNSHQ
ncbi:DUF5077 domain-containing protein [Pedobacter sp. UC225_65]|uniref:DUF5077 domain-containing protein n=1 Tax=Pedobacter sp. UC225_65 TaxID=3350173 RepID=UPI003671E65B